MILLKRLRAIPAVLGVVAALTAVGTSLFGDARDPAKPTGDPTAATAAPTIDEMATKFSKLPVVAYQPKPGETIFAWQIKPELPASPARPRDVLVIVDSSASQAGKPIQQARHIITTLTAEAGPNDRFALWTLSTPAATKALTAGLQPGNSEDLRQAVATLAELEYGSGASDIKGGLAKALATLPPNPGRQQIVLFLGDGESSFDPVSEADRVALGTRMDLNDIYFFAVPLGVKVNPHNLHGFAALTGGAVVRVQEDLNNATQRTSFINRLKASFDVPVFKPEKFQFGAEIAEVYPTRLPPLRADKATLVLGRLANAAPNVTAVVQGKVANAPVSLNLSQPVPAPQNDHFFLNLMIDQWRNAPNKEAPAVLQSDRALALASTQVRLYRNEYLTQAVWAVTMNRLDDAAKMYQAARRIDPTDAESAAGLQLVEKMKAGTVTKSDLEKRIAAKQAEGLKVDKDAVTRMVIQDAGAQPPGTQPPPAGAQPPPNAQQALQEAAAKRKIEEERYRVLTNETIRRARQLLRTDPDAAYADLKRQRDDILIHEGIGDAARTQMVADLEAVMREIFVKGAEIKRAAAAEREQIARTRQRLNEFDRQQSEEERTKARIDAFRQLMQQARYELAYQEAQLMIQERIARGQAVPAEATASYIIGQQATQLREWRELVRIREDRFLLAMMQTEKSHIPYPDEPPVHFPPAAVWRELTGTRKERYENMFLGPEPSPTQKKLRSILEGQRVSYEKQLNDTPLFELLQDLAKRYDVTFIIMEEYFKNEGIQNVRELKPNLTATRLEGLTLGSFLDIVLQSLGATYVVRPDYIEITTFNRRLEEKVTTVFPVADLVIPIPNAVVQSQLIQNLSIQNATLAIFGAASLYGGGLQNFLGGGNNNIGGGFGQPGGNPFGQQGAGGQQGQFFPQGGGIVGLSGNGNVGQFGNLGGQFGLQGQDQSALLINLIFETVAKGEWANVPPPPGAGMMGMEDDGSFLPIPQRNSLGYYPPARALIVRGTSRYHTAGTVKLKAPGMGGQAALPNQGNGAIVIGPGGSNVPKPAANPNPAGVAAKPPENKPAVNPAAAPAGPVVINANTQPVDARLDPAELQKKLAKDPRRMWQQAIDWTVTDPGLIVASAEFLIEMNEPMHAAEILKANLRKGLATDDWAHGALAIALQMSQANPIEVERAALSGIDLDPNNAQAYLRAAKAEADLKHHDVAFAFCQRAAAIAPDRPEAYANALVYAEQANNVKPEAVAWAANHLLRRDWPVSSIDYHAKAREKVDVLVKKFEAAGIKADALKRTQIEQNQRDLVIELLWTGPADLDLFVTEPSGGVCSPTQTRTTGGGLLKGDVLSQRDEGDRSESYIAASAFNGTYKVNVKQAFGRPVGGTAQLKVTKFKGTAKEYHDLIPVNLSNPAPIEIKLEGASRTELAVVSDDPNDFLRAETTGAAATTAPSGFGGGAGPAGTALTTPASGVAPALPVVVKPREQVLPGLGGAADIRASYKMNADRKTYSVTVNPVFATAKGELTMPKVPLLPGGEAAR